MISDKNRIFGLDLLRAFAVFFVVYDHGGNLIHSYVNSHRYSYLTFDGVSFFFILSGFLIGRILLKSITREDFNGGMLLEFWVRRWCRTLPNYLLVLIVLISSYQLLDMPIKGNIFSYFSFSQNIASPHPAFFPEAWSLAIEEWFYLCIPIPFFIATKFPRIDRRTLIVWTIGIVIVTVTIFRCYRAYRYGYSSIHEWDINLRKQVVTRLDSLMFGVAGAYLSLFHSMMWGKNVGKWCLFGIVLILIDKLMSRNIVYANFLGMTVVSFGTLCLLPYLSSWRRSDDLLSRTVTFVSVLSYSMYLLNLSFVQTIGLRIYASACNSCTSEPIVLYILYWIVTIATSYLLYNYFEKHMTGLRDRFTPRISETKIKPA